MSQGKFSIRQRLRSIGFALGGIRNLLSTEHNAIVHLTATLIIFALAVICKIPSADLPALIFAMALVWIAEMVNTCIERVMDFVSTESHPQIKFIKDLAAGAVLIAAFAAILIGSIIFIPKIISIWH